MSKFEASRELLEYIVDRANIGVFILDRDMNVVIWNSFMVAHSGQSAVEVVGKNLFERFPDLPERWFARKIKSVFMLKNFAFTSWEQRSHLFTFKHNRPVTSGMEYMFQDIKLMPIKDAQGEVESVCVMIFDVTDTAIYHSMHQAAMKKMEQMSRTDGLTQLFNRSHWQARLTEEFNRSHRYQQDLTLMLFDLDHFKSINDTYGHLGGDKVLVEVAQMITRSLRDSDVAGRYGGEEFGVLLPSTDLEGAEVVAQRLCRRVCETLIPFEGKDIAISTSIGLAQLTPDLKTPEELISNADEALYQAKEQGRNRVVLYRSDKTKIT
ncbi:MAG: diguanylate cyclase [Ketobacter sp.]|uniref:GGDEF domain-containing protein n=1 Tax=Ketobacter sp. MCCC 1A13808 TaxID=2602738 RepID=UPI0018DBD591|nr:diguanylate cyclase [Ketobacter sp. MCCC 1A13808]